MARSAKLVGSHKKSKSVRRRQRAGVATAVLMTAALGATVPLGAAPASAVDFGTYKDCVGGSGVSNTAVDCSVSIAPPIVGVLPLLGIPLDLNSTASGRERLAGGPLVLDPGTHAKISGLGLAIANAQVPFSYGTAEANAWGFVSGAVAIKVPQNPFAPGGSATATSLPLGLTIAVSGEGTAKAVALGGVATAIGDLGGLIENVSCMALFAQASHSDVGSCTGVLFIFTVSQENGVPGYVFAIADPTSFEILDNQGLIPLPIPNFARDILRVNFGGPSGISFESDLVPPTTTSTLASARVASSPEPGITAVVDESEHAAEPEQSYVGKHRAAEPVAEVEAEPAVPVWTEPAPAAEAEPDAKPPVVTEKPDTTPSTSAGAPTDEQPAETVAVATDTAPAPA